MTRAASAASSVDVVEKHALAFDRPLAGVGASEHQQILDDAPETLRLSLDARAARHVLLRLSRPLQRHLGPAAHDGERRAQLVRRVGHEAAHMRDRPLHRGRRLPRQQPAADRDENERDERGRAKRGDQRRVAILELDLVGDGDRDERRDRRAARHARREREAAGRRSPSMTRVARRLSAASRASSRTHGSAGAPPTTCPERIERERACDPGCADRPSTIEQRLPCGLTGRLALIRATRISSRVASRSDASSSRSKRRVIVANMPTPSSSRMTKNVPTYHAVSRSRRSPSDCGSVARRVVAAHAPSR